MGQKEVIRTIHVCTIYTDIKYDKFLQKLTEARESILKKYPEAHDWNLEFDFHDDTWETDVTLYYERLETPDEMHRRLQLETIAKKICN